MKLSIASRASEKKKTVKVTEEIIEKETYVVECPKTIKEKKEEVAEIIKTMQGDF